MLRMTTVLFVLGWICGCGSITDTLTLKPDGSGVLTRNIILVPEAAELLRSAKSQVSNPFGVSPGIIEAQIQAAFKGEGLTVSDFKATTANDGMSQVQYTVTFTGIQALVKAGFSQAVGIEIKETADGKVMVNQGVQRAILPMLSAGGNATDTLNYLRFVGRGFQYTCIMEMPGKIEKTNGKLTGERTVDWTWRVSDLKTADFTAAESVFANAYAVIDKGAITFGLPVTAGGPDLAGFFSPRKPAPKDKQPLPPAVEAKPGEFVFEIESVNIRRYVRYDNNIPIADNSSNSIDVAVFHPEGVIPISYLDLKLDKLVTDADEDLIADQKRMHWNGGETPVRMHAFRGMGPQAPKFDLQLEFSGAQKKFEMFKEVSGSFTLKYAMGIGESVTIEHVGQWVGRRLEGAGLEDREIKIESINGGNIRVAFANKDMAELHAIMFYDKDNTPQEDKSRMGMGMSTTISDETTTQEYRYNGGDEGKVVLVFYKDLKTTSIPFRLENISIKGAVNADGKGWDDDFEVDDIEMIEVE